MEKNTPVPNYDHKPYIGNGLLYIQSKLDLIQRSKIILSRKLSWNKIMKRKSWMDRWIAFLRPFQQYFSHIRTMDEQ